MKRPAFWPGLALQNKSKAHAPLPGMPETENMNADQGFRRAPGNLLRVAAGAGAAALIVTAVSAARRARTAMADREWPADGRPAPWDVTRQPHRRSGPAAAPKTVTASDLAAARSRSARRCWSLVSPRCRLSLAVAGPTASEALRTRGHRDVRMRTGTTSSRGETCRTAAILDHGRPWSGREEWLGTTPISWNDGLLSSTWMTTLAGPDARARTLSTPITRAGGRTYPPALG